MGETPQLLALQQLLSYLNAQDLNPGQPAIYDARLAPVDAPFGVNGFRYDRADGLSFCDAALPRIARWLSDVALPSMHQTSRFKPFFLDPKGIDESLLAGENPLLYSAYRDICPPRRKAQAEAAGTDDRNPFTHWYADLIDYRYGVLPGDEMFRSIGHWNKAIQLEIFQTMFGCVTIVVAGYNVFGKPYLYHHVLRAGDFCIVAPGAWHLTYVLEESSVVFNIYTDTLQAIATGAETPVDHSESAKYHTRPPVEVALRRGRQGMEFVMTAKAIAQWGAHVPCLNNDALLATLNLDTWLMSYFLQANDQALETFESQLLAAFHSGWPIDQTLAECRLTAPPAHALPQ